MARTLKLDMQIIAFKKKFEYMIFEDEKFKSIFYLYNYIV